MKNGPSLVHAQSPRTSSVAQSLDGKGRLKGSLHFPGKIKIARQERSRKTPSQGPRAINAVAISDRPASSRSIVAMQPETESADRLHRLTFSSRENRLPGRAGKSG
jgi:hypothetical protein